MGVNSCYYCEKWTGSDWLDLRHTKQISRFFDGLCHTVGNVFSHTAEIRHRSRMVYSQNRLLRSRYFLFLSGLGVYYSLTKRPNVLGFYKARLVRILPAYIIVACASYCLLRLDRASALDFFYYISGIGYWTRHARFDWYIPTQLAFYLITPLFLFFYKKLGGKKQIIYTSACMSLSVPLCVIMYYNDLIYLWGTAVRLSVFLLGIHTGRLAEQDKKVLKLR